MNELKPMNERELEQIVNEGISAKTKNYKKIFESKAIVDKNVRNEIKPPEPILMLNSKPLINKRTINTAQGKSGAWKSRLSEIMCAEILKKINQNANLLGIERSIENIAVCYVDTERNLSDQFPYAIQQIKINAGYEIGDDIPNLDFISLIDIDRADRFNAFEEYLQKYLRETYKGHIFIVIDVITDLVENFNDPKDSLRLIDLLNRAINTYDVTFLCIIHENPFQEKARGHLGTELINKSSIALSINYEKDSRNNELDIIKIQSLKSRSAKKFEPMYLKFSESRNSLVLAKANEIEQAKSLQDIKANIHDVAKFLIENSSEEISKGELIELLKENFNCGTRTIEDRIKDLLNGNVMNDFGYQLFSTKKGKTLYYKIEKFNQAQTESDGIDSIKLPETPSKSPE